MKTVLSWIAALVVLASAAQAAAEYRTVLLRAKSDAAGKVTFAIDSDVKEERRQEATVEEAAKVVAGMKGWGSAVGVYIVVEKDAAFHGKPILKAIADNVWLELVYLGPDLPKHLAEHFQQLRAE